MKNIRVLLTSVPLYLFALTSGAQTMSTYKLDWSTSFSPAWSTGQTSRTASNVGGSGTNISVGMAIGGGGVFTTTLGPYGGPMTPTVSASTFIVPGSAQNLQISLDYTTNASFVDVTFNFSTMVSGVSFRIADIDRLTNTAYNYLDEVVINGSNGVTNYLPTITKYNNSDPNFLVVSGNIARVNGTSGYAGNTASDATDQKGTVNVVFGTSLMNSVRIRYRNATGTQADPTVQNISIGDITFQKQVLPVKLLSFEASVKNQRPSLEWKTSAEVDFSHFLVERSDNGTDFYELARVEASGNADNTVTVYRYSDVSLNGSKYFYRLKMVDIDGTYSYSKVVVAQLNQPGQLTIFPTVFRDQFNVAVKASVNASGRMYLTDISGRVILTKNYSLVPGMNQFTVEVPSHLPAGQYFLKLDESHEAIRIIRE